MLQKFPHVDNKTPLPLSHAEHKHIRALQKRSVREEEALCVLEGEHLCEEYLQHCLKFTANNSPNNSSRLPLLHSIIICSDDTVSPQIHTLAQKLITINKNTRFRTASTQKFELLTDTTTPQKILAVIDMPIRPMSDGEPLLILDGIADPGNLGTIIRTADWFGFRNILIGEGSADRFHPKTLRATMGSIFRCAVHSTKNLAQTIESSYADYSLWGASLQGTLTLAECANRIRSSSERYGIVMGNEARGISPHLINRLAGTFRINGGKQGTESLNVGIATGIILYEMSKNEVV